MRFRKMARAQLREAGIPVTPYRGEYNLLMRLEGHGVNNASMRSMGKHIKALDAVFEGFHEITRGKYDSLTVVIPGKLRKIYHKFVFAAPVGNKGTTVQGQYFVAEPKRAPVQIDQARVSQPFDYIEQFGARVSNASRVTVYQGRAMTKPTVLFAKQYMYPGRSRSQLQKIARELGLGGWSRMDKPELEAAILNYEQGISWKEKPENSFITSNENSSWREEFEKFKREFAASRAEYRRELKKGYGIPSNVNVSNISVSGKEPSSGSSLRSLNNARSWGSGSTTGSQRSRTPSSSIKRFDYGSFGPTPSSSSTSQKRPQKKKRRIVPVRVNNIVNLTRSSPSRNFINLTRN